MSIRCLCCIYTTMVLPKHSVCIGISFILIRLCRWRVEYFVFNRHNLHEVLRKQFWACIWSLKAILYKLFEWLCVYFNRNIKDWFLYKGNKTYFVVCFCSLYIAIVCLNAFFSLFSFCYFIGHYRMNELIFSRISLIHWENNSYII